MFKSDCVFAEKTLRCIQVKAHAQSDGLSNLFHAIQHEQNLHKLHQVNQTGACERAKEVAQATELLRATGINPTLDKLAKKIQQSVVWSSKEQCWGSARVLGCMRGIYQHVVLDVDAMRAVDQAVRVCGLSF